MNQTSHQAKITKEAENYSRALESGAFGTLFDAMLWCQIHMPETQRLFRQTPRNNEAQFPLIAHERRF
ncbi:hypothetical protein FACS1894186_7520 [Alphaproteobacteria bacterium]|nr:hypothetical protein FACS1894186_7520 [Alphaproteobacteria bacterium]